MATKQHYKDISGQVFGRLTAIERVGKNRFGHSLWKCACSCGNETTTLLQSLTRGITRSCGCLDHEAHLLRPNRRVHGDWGTRLYRIWKAMKTRCNNPNNPSYIKWYGAKGVKVCDEWNKSFIPFKEWALSHGYREDLSIDRINPYGDYEPSNCRWATASEQARNKRKGDKNSPP